MKQFLFILLALPFNLLFAQKPDSITITEEVYQMVKRSKEFIDLFKLDDALQLTEKAEKIALDSLGRMSAAYAACLHSRVEICIKRKLFKDALPLCIEAKDIRRQVLGEKDPVYAISVNYLATLYRDLGDCEKAMQLALEAEAIRSVNPGTESFEYGATMNLLGTLYYYFGDYKQAESSLIKAKKNFEKSRNTNPLPYINASNNLTVLYHNWGNFDNVEKNYWEVIEAKRKTSMEEPEIYAASLNNLGWFFLKTGQYIKAENLFNMAKDFTLKYINKNNEPYAVACIGLASVYLEKGLFNKADINFQEGLGVMEKTGNIMYIAALNNFGALQAAIGDDERAEKTFLQVKKIWDENGDDKNRPDYATLLINLGNLYLRSERYEEAEKALTDVKTIRQKSLKPNHPDIAASINSLATFYSSIGKLDTAESLLHEAEKIMQDSFNVDHPIKGALLNNLASIYSSKKDYALAEKTYLEAKEFNAKNLGKAHPYYIIPLTGLAPIYWLSNRTPECISTYLEMNNAIRKNIENQASYFSEREMQGYLHDNEIQWEQLYSLSQTHFSRELNCAAFDNALIYKGFILENMRLLFQEIAHADSLTRDTFDRWQGFKQQIADAYTEAVSDRKNLQELEYKIDDFEKKLARKLHYFNQIRQTPRWKDIRSHLASNEAAIEFIHYRYRHPDETDSIMYAALVLLPNDSFPHFIPLCEQKSLDKVLKIRYPNQRYLNAPDQNSLYSLLWQPLEPLLNGINTIYFSPSGALHTVNLDAIALDAKGEHTLLDDYTLVRLGSTRQLLDSIRVEKGVGNALLFGAINYEPNGTAIQKQNAKNGVTLRAGVDDENPPPNIIKEKNTPLQPLPNTITQLKFIQQVMDPLNFKVQAFTDFAASEEVFKQLAGSNFTQKKSARVIHLATHGFFFSTPENRSSKNNMISTNEPYYKISEHPYMRSGLTFSGANYAWQTGKPLKEGMEDGILTAYDISAMSLPNTELVVLSACETGLGDLSTNEGVYGLQRAFKIAGAQYLIMSLWSVPLDETNELMIKFYRNWLEKKMEIPQAFREAQKEMKQKNNDPDKWAGFVLLH